MHFECKTNSKLCKKSINIAFLWEKHYLKSYLKALFNFWEIPEFIIITAPLYSTGIQTKKFWNFKIILIPFYSHEKFTAFIAMFSFSLGSRASVSDSNPVCNLCFGLLRKWELHKPRAKKRTELSGFFFNIRRRCQLTAP